MVINNKIYQFKITLENIQPEIWRRIQVPETYSFWDLHVAIQDSMGWLDYHLHQFIIRDSLTGSQHEIGIPDGEYAQSVFPGWKRLIKNYFTPENPQATYLYDFGDGWELMIALEEIKPQDINQQYPICLAGARACPPEDCGGIGGYEELLKILQNPRHKEYKETLQWVGGKFDPDYFDPQSVKFDDPKERFKIAFG